MLTQTQLQILKTDIAADSALSQVPKTSDGAFAVAAAYNLAAVPAFRVWRTDIPTRDIKAGIVWTEYIGRSVGERGAFELMISNGVLDAANPNVRQGITDCFSGPSGAGTRTNLTNLAKRDALRVEKLFSTGTGSEAVPATMTVEGAVSYQDVQNAWSS
jgi:hypothetical protein